MRHGTGLALVAIAATLMGCGATGSGRGPGARPSAPGSSAPGSSGQKLFAANCSVCHSLSGVQSPRRQGGDLLGDSFSPAVTLQFTREMPTRRRLTSAELRTVADYVVSVQHRSR
jgi:mono/diheme cytochrome c family protein